MENRRFCHESSFVSPPACAATSAQLLFGRDRSQPYQRADSCGPSAGKPRGENTNDGARTAGQVPTLHP